VSRLPPNFQIIFNAERNTGFQPVRPANILSASSRFNLQFLLLLLILVGRRGVSEDQDHDQEHEQEKARTAFAARASDYYPANAVKVDIPFPFGNGRMTAARASDFQLRHVIFPMQPSLLVNEISVRESHL
jgi:hypothetical protein